MYRASCFNVLINQRDATLLISDLYYPLVSSTCFGLSPVHHQEHPLMTGPSYIHTTARIICMNIPMRYTVHERMLLMMDW